MTLLSKSFSSLVASTRPYRRIHLSLLRLARIPRPGRSLILPLGSPPSTQLSFSTSRESLSPTDSVEDKEPNGTLPDENLEWETDYPPMALNPANVLGRHLSKDIVRLFSNLPLALGVNKIRGLLQPQIQPVRGIAESYGIRATFPEKRSSKLRGPSAELEALPSSALATTSSEAGIETRSGLKDKLSLDVIASSLLATATSFPLLHQSLFHVDSIFDWNPEHIQLESRTPHFTGRNDSADAQFDSYRASEPVLSTEHGQPARKITSPTLATSAVSDEESDMLETPRPTEIQKTYVDESGGISSKGAAKHIQKATLTGEAFATLHRLHAVASRFPEIVRGHLASSGGTYAQPLENSAANTVIRFQSEGGGAPTSTELQALATPHSSEFGRVPRAGILPGKVEFSMSNLRSNNEIRPRVYLKSVSDTGSLLKTAVKNYSSLQRAKTLTEFLGGTAASPTVGYLPVGRNFGGPSKNIGDLVSAYSSLESYRTRLRLTADRPARAVQRVELPSAERSPTSLGRPNLMRESHVVSTQTILQTLRSQSAESPSLSTTQSSRFSTAQLPEIADEERPTLSLQSRTDSEEMDDLRLKLSRILAEEARRYLAEE